MKLYLNGPRLPFGFRLGLGVDPMEYLSTLGVPRLMSPQETGRGSFLYVITDGLGNSKLGVSRNPLQRLRDLQSGHPERLELAWVAVTPGDGYNIEDHAKRSTEHLRAAGGTEWRRAHSSELVQAMGLAAMLLQEPIRHVPLERLAEAVEELSRWQAPPIPLAPPPLPELAPVVYRRPLAFILWVALAATLVFAAFFVLLELGQRGRTRPSLQGDLGDLSQYRLHLVQLMDERAREERARWLSAGRT